MLRQVWLIQNIGCGVVLILLCSPGRADDEWIDLIGPRVSNDWRLNSPDHWTTGSSVHMPKERPDSLVLKPGHGLMFAPGATKSREANIATKREFGDIRLQAEFLIPGESNSGIYLMGRYEVQIKDSFGKPAIDSHDCGAIYQRWDDSRPAGQEGYEGHVPRVNASRAPGQWQSFDIEFRAPRFDDSDTKIVDAVFVKVLHNDVEIHSNVKLTGPTRGAMFDTESSTGPILLQGNHGPIAFRKLRVRENRRE